MTDLEKFIELYSSLGIELVLTNGLRDTQETLRIVLSEGFFGEMGITYSDKFEGYDGFQSVIDFDLSGKFIKQGFWE